MTPWLVWDEGELTEARKAQLKEDFPEASDKELGEWAQSDHDYYRDLWALLCEALTEWMQQVNPGNHWHAEVTGFGWRHLDGSKDFDAPDGRMLLRQLLPDTDCTFKIFKESDKTLKIQNWHHDAPDGQEWYTVEPRLIDDE